MTREEAIKDIEECVLPYIGGISLRMAIADMKEMDRLAKAEPVLKEPDRPHGEWIFKHNSADIWCSICDENFDEIPQKFLFCPNCGADMRKEGDEK